VFRSGVYKCWIIILEKENLRIRGLKGFVDWESWETGEILLILVRGKVDKIRVNQHLSKSTNHYRQNKSKESKYQNPGLKNRRVLANNRGNHLRLENQGFQVGGNVWGWSWRW